MDDVPRINGTPWAWEMSDDDLSNAGFPVIKTDMMLGSRVVVRPGMSRTQAVSAAWAAGVCNVGGHQFSPHGRRMGVL